MKIGGRTYMYTYVRTYIYRVEKKFMFDKVQIHTLKLKRLAK